MVRWQRWCAGLLPASDNPRSPVLQTQGFAGAGADEAGVAGGAAFVVEAGGGGEPAAGAEAGFGEGAGGGVAAGAGDVEADGLAAGADAGTAPDLPAAAGAGEAAAFASAFPSVFGAALPSGCFTTTVAPGCFVTLTVLPSAAGTSTGGVAVAAGAGAGAGAVTAGFSKSFFPSAILSRCSLVVSTARISVSRNSAPAR